MADDAADPFPSLGSVYRGSGSISKQMSRNKANIERNSDQTGDSRVKSRPWCSQNSTSNAWGQRQPNETRKLTNWGNGETAGANSINKLVEKSNSPKNLSCSGNGVTDDSKLLPQSVICPHPENAHEKSDDDILDSESDIVFDSEDDLSLDDTDSDTGEKSHERSMKSKWLRDFFDNLSGLTAEEITSQARLWHCPACKGGPGAIDWYQGLQPLLNHSKTIQSRRARLHRLFAETLEEECYRRRVPLTMVNEACGRWEGLDKKVKDHEIVWPPMVVIMNTRYAQDENSKWNGMGNQELLDYFGDYAALKARHSYGPHGHRGMSVLIFETSPAGYLEAVRLHKHFKEQGRDREAWDRCQNPFVAGGKRQLYGYLASREDMDIFNRHSGGKSKLKFEMRSYQEMVESKIKHINDESRQLGYFKNMIAKEQIKSQVLADSLSKVSEKLRLTTEENRVVRERTREQHQHNKEEMDAQEIFFQDQMQIIQQAIAAKEDNFEKLQQAKREIVKQSCGYSSEAENDKHRVENISSFIRLQDKEMRQFEAQRENIIKIYEDKKLALKKKQWQEQVELEKEFENELTQLMDKYTSGLSLEESFQK